MSFDLSDDELERQLGTMLQERAGAVSERVAVDRRVIKRARRRRTMKLASVGSGLALAVAVVAVAAVSFTGSPLSSSKNAPASGGPKVQLSVPPTVPSTVPPLPSGWSTLPPAPISARAASATAIADDAFVVWGGAGPEGVRLMDGAWYDLRSGEWNVMSKSPLPTPSYPPNHHFVVGQAVGNSVVIVSDGAAALYTPRTNVWRHLPDVPLASLDNLALASPNAANAIVLTGVNRAGQPAYAALDFDSGAARFEPVWTTGTLTGRSFGRPALFNGGFWVVVHTSSGRAELEAVYGFKGPATVMNSNLTTNFLPTVWNGTSLFGGTCKGCASTTLIDVDPNGGVAAPIADVYDACAGVHVWTGSAIVSWGTPLCAHDDGVAYDIGSGAVSKLPAAPIAERSASDFAVSNTGSVYIWGGQDAADRYLDDGAVLTLP